MPCLLYPVLLSATKELIWRLLITLSLILQHFEATFNLISGVGEIVLVVFLVVAAFGGVALLIWKMVPQADKDNVSIATTSSLAGTGIFGRRNRDLFSDRISIYSISLSEKADSKIGKPNDDGDNTSEA